VNPVIPLIKAPHIVFASYGGEKEEEKKSEKLFDFFQFYLLFVKLGGWDEILFWRKWKSVFAK
jgi:hypothetical protein